MIDLEHYDNNNIFAKIIRKESSATIVFENEYCLAFYDINPVASFHVLLVPKGRYTCYNDFIKNSTLPERESFFESIFEISRKFNLSNGYRIISNIGPDAQQIVPHFHIHIIAKKKLPHKSLDLME